MKSYLDNVIIVYPIIPVKTFILLTQMILVQVCCQGYNQYRAISMNNS